MKNAIKHLAILALATSLAACGGGSGDSGSASSSSSSSLVTSGSSAVTALQIIDNQVGTGATAAAGNTLTVTYSGWLYDSAASNLEGTEFNANQTFPFALGEGQVIPGWDQGLVGMKVGGTRTLIVPASLAYGAAGVTNSSGQVVIPPNTALVFTVQLLSVQ